MMDDEELTDDTFQIWMETSSIPAAVPSAWECTAQANADPTMGWLDSTSAVWRELLPLLKKVHPTPHPYPFFPEIKAIE